MWKFLILDSIGSLVDPKDGFDFDCNKEEFKRTVTKAYTWVPQFFKFVKSKYGRRQASFVFLTNKPMNWTIDTPIAHSIKGRAKEIDAYNDEELCLKLSQEQAIGFVKTQFKNEKKKARIVKQITEMSEEEFSQSNWCIIGELAKEIR